jgi:hypothetical protein
MKEQDKTEDTQHQAAPSTKRYERRTTKDEHELMTTTTTTTRPAAKFCFLCLLDEVFVFLFSSGRRMMDDG